MYLLMMGAEMLTLALRVLLRSYRPKTGFAAVMCDEEGVEGEVVEK